MSLRCRRWTGGGVATLVWFGDGELAWHGTPVVFRSSPIARRAHRGVCDTPHYLEYGARSYIIMVSKADYWAGIGAGLPDGEMREKW